jgi:penicillin-binding protein 2
MAVSSDVYFYGLGDRLYSGPPASAADGPIQAVAARLGFGRPTGIDIGPEASGRIPGPTDRREAQARRPAAVPDGAWYPGDNVNLSIGQGDMLATPLQLAGAYATLATGLAPPTPHVLAGGSTSSSAIGPRPSAGLDPAALRAVMAGLNRAVGTREGTAAAAFAGFPLDRVPIAGKTGTAQVNGKADTSLFAAIAPANDPRYVVVAVIEEGGFGSTVAAPIVRRVLEVLTGVGPPAPGPPGSAR